MAFIKKGNITLNKSSQAAMKNQPLFSVGNKDLAGYVSVRMYDQTNITSVGGSAPSGWPIFTGTSMKSGFPGVLVDATVAENIVTV